MARPRKISDGELMAATAVALGRHGPGFTLAQVADEAGVVASTIAQRAGSKHALLTSMITQAADRLVADMRAAAEGESDPRSAIRAAALVTADAIDDPETTANHLGQFGVDLADPALRVELARSRRDYRQELERMITAADLPRIDPARAARLLAATVQGLQIDWAMDPVGDLLPELKGVVDELLASWAA